MRLALKMAARAESEGEVPVGAIVIKDGEVVGSGWNRTIGLHDASAHAEIIALREAGERLGNYRLPECEMFVTLEPCPMCAGALVHARLSRLVYGAADPKTGAAGGCFDHLLDPRHNHRVEVKGGCLAEDCAGLLQAFFRDKRKRDGSG
jgi:tRNA(adenine34) deaminase